MNAPREIPESIGGSERHLYRNSSEAPMVMKASPFGGWEDLKKSKLNLEGAFKGNWATAHGHKFEDQARQAFAKKNGIKLLGPERFVNGQYAASLDDRFDEDEEHWILEIKCPAQGKKSKIWNAVMDYADPLYYRWQMTNQMIAYPKATGVVLFIYDSETGDSCECEVLRNKAAEAALMAAWDEFYAWMESDQPDPSNGVVVRSDDLWCETADRFKNLKKAADLATEELETCRQELIALAETAKETGNGVTVQKTERKGNVNYKKIPELQGVDLELYRAKSTEVSTVTIDKETK